MTTDCPYCGDSVPDDAYVSHLRRGHDEDDLTAIDRRRVRAARNRPNRGRLVLYAGLGGVLLLFVLGYGLVAVSSGPGPSSAAVTPDPTNGTHEHGRITVQYDDQTVDLSDPRYLEADECFHFHEDESDGGSDDEASTYEESDHERGAGSDHHGDTPASAVWHAHCENVTLEYALETLGMTVTSDSATIDGREYAEADGDEVTVTVDGDPVDPREYELQGVESVEDANHGAGDDVRVVVRSAD
ncbi:hypothetical protein ACFPYI_06405 [Halomarina salina]|uniref:C2H2-type domain-containing protein n=1 Tax=Halomarina salina TaxID=1872699 RepID=A0ABD5RK06_9EURY|nr:hypothetical protein [Halomarina salina]